MNLYNQYRAITGKRMTRRNKPSEPEWYDAWKEWCDAVYERAHPFNRLDRAKKKFIIDVWENVICNWRFWLYYSLVCVLVLLCHH